MMLAIFKSLVIRTIHAPRAAVAQAIGLGLAPQAAWLILFLVTVLMSLCSSLVLFLMLPDDPQLAALIQSLAAYQAPVIFAALQIAQAALGVYLLCALGRLLGGQARTEDLVIGMVLVQVAALILGLGVAVLARVLPMIEGFGFIAFLAWGIWASATMVDVAHRFNNAGKALIVLLLSGCVILIISMLFVTLFLSPSPSGGL